MHRGDRVGRPAALWARAGVPRVREHATSPNMVESEIGCSVTNASTVGSVLAGASKPKSSPGNDGGTPRARIKCMFAIDKVRAKMGRTYPCQADIPGPKLKKS